VIPLALLALALANPGLADGQGFMRARCAEPCYGKASHERTEVYSYQRPASALGRPRQRKARQLAERAKAKQPTLFELKDDYRPPAERTAAGRYLEPSLSTLPERRA